ncbi:ATP-dependent Clp protease ATP-binding subunit [Microbacterium sp. M3]|uniref:ATP-dependent Clp protease ATP-binding subunit n=1 Tax=Microbacterium arthrosphaerae TaxID=792652 RepID=A0ABU4GW95_9MICO|nr:MULTISPECIES: ATP-dependent Clp protease ATP-binding subunit [Microbacterium]MDW4571337.1 ATP-dependent Clp protease ATP-binding subunit [Microbacterium arthrosphaerae]MDW7605192.1 ATP-dependent Clp protease ATP-binding subunit [Microbacterium sp. M3]
MPEDFTPQAAGDGSSFDEFLARYLAGERARAERSIDLSRFLGARTQQLLQRAGKYALDRGQHELDALHVLRVLVAEAPARDAVRRIGADADAIVRATEERLPAPAAAADVDGAVVTSSVQRALFHAYQVARSSGSTYVDPEHLFFALVLAQDTPAGQVLARAGVTAEALTQGARETVSPSNAPATDEADAAASDTPMLDTYGTDLTARALDGELDPVIGRADEIEQTIEILSRRTKNNPVLVGEAGVGKTAIVEGLAQAIVEGAVPEQLLGKRVVALDLPAMLAGTRYRGDFEERLTKTMDEIADRKDELIVFIDEVHTVVGAGGAGDGGMDAGNILKPRLARGELHLVGATTLKEYRVIEKDPALERRFQPVRVGEPSVEDAVLILHGLKPAYEEHHGIVYTDEALRAAVELSDRYLTERVLPDKAIDLIDQAGARLRLRLGARAEGLSSRRISGLIERLATLEADKNAAVSAEHYEEASRIRDQIADVQEQLDRATAPSQGISRETQGDALGLGENPRVRDAGTPAAVVDEAQIAAVISRATGIPVNRLTETERERLAALEDELHDRVIGQHDAVTAVAKAVRRSRTGMGDARRPVGSFLLLGPTGVGKTELAKALAGSLFDDDTAVIRFDMSEFGERHTVSRLVGAPPGYVGYDEAGQLTERVRRNPYSIVLFDEIEKAHPDVFNLLLQVLDDGRLTDGQGRTVDFRNTVIVMTSNLGSEFLASRGGAIGFLADGGGSTGFGSEKDLRDRVFSKLREAMRPEFLNRIDEIVLFRKLEKPQLQSIVRLLLGASDARLAQREVSLVVTDSAVAWLADNGYEPEYGARPLRRLIQREVDDRIADLFVTGALVDGGTVTVDAAADALTVVSGSPFAQAA